MNREEWLEKLVEYLRPHYLASEVPIPDRVRVSVGWPSQRGLSEKNRVVGQCWMIESTADAVNQIYISPLLAEGIQAAKTLAHELVHAALPTGSGHKKPFIAACKKAGLTDGPPKSVEPGPELTVKIEAMLAEMPPYPHAAITPKSADKKQTTRMLRLSCTGDETDELHEEYILRGTKKVIALGLPICPLCEKEMKTDDAEKGEEGD